MMDDSELSKLLEQLHKEIEHAEMVDERGKELLRHLEADIRELIDRSENAPMQPDESLMGQLEETVDQFAVTHPTLSIVMSKVLETLSNLGI